MAPGPSAGEYVNLMVFPDMVSLTGVGLVPLRYPSNEETGPLNVSVTVVAVPLKTSTVESTMNTVLARAEAVKARLAITPAAKNIIRFIIQNSWVVRSSGKITQVLLLLRSHNSIESIPARLDPANSRS